MGVSIVWNLVCDQCRAGGTVIAAPRLVDVQIPDFYEGKGEPEYIIRPARLPEGWSYDRRQLTCGCPDPYEEEE